MSLALAFLRRDLLIWSSYRLAALWHVSAVCGIALVVYLLGSAVGDKPDWIDEEGGNYVAFILVGFAFLDVLFQGLSSLPLGVNEHQRTGTLETMLLAPIPDGALLLSFWFFRFSLSMVRMVILLTFGFVVLGFWHSANPVTVIAVFVPSLLTFVAIGALSAAFVIIVKQGDPIRMAFAASTAALGGALFPVEALPDWLRPLALAVPLTSALSGIREGLSGATVADTATEIIALSAQAAVLLPAGFLAFSWSLRRAKQEGSLGEY